MMTASQLAEWVAYDRLEPIDEQLRAEYRNGLNTATLANILIQANSDPKKSPKLYKVDDFIIDFEKSKHQKDELNQKELQNKIMAAMINLGAKV